MRGHRGQWSSTHTGALSGLDAIAGYGEIRASKRMAPFRRASPKAHANRTVQFHQARSSKRLRRVIEKGERGRYHQNRHSRLQMRSEVESVRYGPCAGSSRHSRAKRTCGRREERGMTTNIATKAPHPLMRNNTVHFLTLLLPTSSQFFNSLFTTRFARRKARTASRFDGMWLLFLTNH